MIREMRDCEWKTNFSEFSCLSPFVFVFWQFAFDCPDDRLENSMMKGMTDVESWLMHFFIVQKIISGSFSRIREFEFSVRLNSYFASTSLDGFGIRFCRSSQSSKHEFLSMTSNIVLAAEFSGFSRSSYVMFPLSEQHKVSRSAVKCENDSNMRCVTQVRSGDDRSCWTRLGVNFSIRNYILRSETSAGGWIRMNLSSKIAWNEINFQLFYAPFWYSRRLVVRFSPLFSTSPLHFGNHANCSRFQRSPVWGFLWLRSHLIDWQNWT